MTVTKGQQWVSVGLRGARGTGSVQETTATYADVLPATTVAYHSGSDALKETITLAGAGAPASFSYDLRTSPGLTVAAAAGGAQVSDGSGQAVFAIPAPTVSDQRGAAGPAR